MRLFSKIIGVIVIILAVAVLSLGLVLSHDTACASAPALSANATSMKAIVYRCYGSPAVLQFEDIEKPVAADDEVLVKIHAAGVNPLDWHYMRGSPYLMRLQVGLGAPESIRMGVDFAGTVEAVGKNVTRFKPGDEVFGGRDGAFAQYVTIREDRAIVPKPTAVTFEQAAAAPIAAITALQALRDKGHLKAGQKVLINGASGGVGTFAVQIAKSFGADVTGVCSARNAAMVMSIGADRVIDYKRENFTESEERYDLIIDNIGNHALLDYRKVMKPDGILVMVGGPKGDWIGPLLAPIKALLLSPFVSQDFVMIMASLTQEDLTVLGDLMASGEMTSVIDRRYPLSEVPAAIRYSEAGHASGKIIIAVE